MKGGRRAVGGEHTSEHLQSEVAQRLAAQVLLAQREAMMSSREQWVPPLAPYEKGVTPTEMIRARDGSGKQPSTRDGMTDRRPGPSDSYSRAATRDEDTDSDDEGGGKRPMHSQGGKSPMHPYKGGKGLMSFQASQAERQEQPEGRLEEREDLAGLSEDELRDELIMYERQPQEGEGLRSLQLRVLLARAQLPDYTDEDSLIDVARIEADLEFLAKARRQRDRLLAEVEDRMDSYVDRGYDKEGYSAHMAAAIQYEELVISLTEKMQENWRALLKLQKQKQAALDDMYRRAQRTPVQPQGKNKKKSAAQMRADLVRALEEEIRLLESWREELYDHMFSMKWTKSTWAYGDGKINLQREKNGEGQDNKERFLYPKWKKAVKAMYDTLPAGDSDGFLLDKEDLDEMIEDNTSDPFNIDKGSTDFLERILKLAKDLNKNFIRFRNESYLKNRNDGKTQHNVPEEKGKTEKWRKVINETLYPKLPLNQNPYTSMSEGAMEMRRFEQDRKWYNERVKSYLRMRGELQDIKFGLDALRRQVQEEGRVLDPYEEEQAYAKQRERDNLLRDVEVEFQALKYDDAGNVQKFYDLLPAHIKEQMGDRRGDGGIWGLTPKEALKDFE